MKKTLLILSLLVLTLSNGCFALSADDFSKGNAFKSEALTELNELEATLLTYDTEMSYVDLITEKPQYAQMNLMASDGFSIENMDWAAFAWGFCCCPIGFFVVAINSDKSSDSKLSYWIGVGVNAVLGAISSGGYYATL